MVATFSKLHDDVEQSSLRLSLATGSIDRINILLENLLVPLDLHLRHSQVNINLLLGQQTLLNIALYTTEKEGPKYPVKLLDHRVLVPILAREPLVKSFGITENVRKQEVE